MNLSNMQIIWAVFIVTGVLNIIPASTQMYMDSDQNTYTEVKRGNGEYTLLLRTADGTERHESGNFESDGSFFVVGHYAYIDPTGKEQYVSYYADKTGYHPTLMKRPVTGGSTVFSGPLPNALVATLIG